jgi:hypothetical protein
VRARRNLHIIEEGVVLLGSIFSHLGGPAAELALGTAALAETAAEA